VVKGTTRWGFSSEPEALGGGRRHLLHGRPFPSVAREEEGALLARCAKNRALYELLTPQQLKGRGRKRIYGDRSRHPHQWLGERGGWRTAATMVRGRQLRLRFRVEGPFVLRKAAERPVYLLVVKGVKRHSRKLKREPTYWLVSACKDAQGEWVMVHEAEHLLAWAWQRWEVEVSHREMKSSFGLGEIQCWNARSVVMATRWQAWCYGVMVLAGYRAWRLSEGPSGPPGRWWSGSLGDGLLPLCGADTARSCGAVSYLGHFGRQPQTTTTKERRLFWG
jgi:hypothetical protein